MLLSNRLISASDHFTVHRPVEGVLRQAKNRSWDRGRIPENVVDQIHHVADIGLPVGV